MPMLPPARVGDAFAAVDTPALIVDLDAFERNLKRMADRAKELGVRLRPHAKTHKSPVIARLQMDLGAVGVCCQKVSEAEVLVAGGVSDVLISNEVVGAAKLTRLAALARRARLGVCVDDLAVVPALSGAAVAAGATIHVLVEIDVGGRRCGAAHGAPAVAIADAVAKAQGLAFEGIQAYHGPAQHYRTPAERREAIEEAARRTRETVALLAEQGLACRTVGGAGTGTYEIEGASGLWNEMQPGSYIFLDADYAKNTGDDAPGRSFEHALFVKAGVMSRPTTERAVLDAGHKALSNDSGFPTVWKRPDLRYERPSDEHGVLDLTAATSPAPALGDTLLLIPGHCDPTIGLYDWYVGVRGLHTPQARVECLWPVAGRGAVT